jgi:F-type H+-transporting ATPase subunit d
MCVFLLKLVELKEAEEKSLKESERLEKEIADVQELKVIEITTWIFQFYEIEKSLIPRCVFSQKKLSTMTADEYFAKHPELKKKFDDEIRNDYWGY